MFRKKIQKKSQQKQPVVVNYCYQHILAAASMTQLRQQTLLNAMVIFIIGLAMALPSLLFFAIQYGQERTPPLQESTQAAIYLKVTATEKQTQSLVDSLEKTDSVGKVLVISPEQGLSEFKSYAELGTAIDALDHNPLPTVIQVNPTSTKQQKAFQTTLNLSSNTAIDGIDLDTDWIQRFSSLIHLGSHTLILIATLLGTSMLCIIGSMIYLVLQKYSHDIEIFLNMGASRRFVRRPYLYMGLYYGFFATCANGLILVGAYQWLAPAAKQLAATYGTVIHFSWPNPETLVGSLTLGLALGFMGARLATWQFLRQQEQ